MIKLHYARMDKRLADESWQSYMQGVPEQIRHKINGYKRWEDRQARMFGILLLEEGLEGFGCDRACLNDISSDRYGRLFINDHFDFNISHSGEYIVCAIADAGRVGVDIEKIKPIELSELDQYLTEDESENIRKAGNSLSEFYKYWTIKESILKADGKGLSVDLREISIDRNRAKFQGHSWFLRNIPIDPDYSCYLASNLEDFEFQMTETDLLGRKSAGGGDGR